MEESYDIVNIIPIVNYYDNTYIVKIRRDSNDYVFPIYYTNHKLSDEEKINIAIQNFIKIFENNKVYVAKCGSWEYYCADDITNINIKLTKKSYITYSGIYYCKVYYSFDFSSKEKSIENIPDMIIKDNNNLFELHLSISKNKHIWNTTGKNMFIDPNVDTFLVLSLLYAKEVEENRIKAEQENVKKEQEANSELDKLKKEKSELEEKLNKITNMIK